MREAYKKPTILHGDVNRMIFPAVAGALAVGIAAALAKGRSIIDSEHTQVLTQRIESNTGVQEFRIGVI